jgi:hypothetical protein
VSALVDGRDRENASRTLSKLLMKTTLEAVGSTEEDAGGRAGGSKMMPTPATIGEGSPAAAGSRTVAAAAGSARVEVGGPAAVSTSGTEVGTRDGAGASI